VPIYLIVNPNSRLDSLELTFEQAESLAMPALRAQGLDVILKTSQDPALLDPPSYAILYPLTSDWPFPSQPDNIDSPQLAQRGQNNLGIEQRLLEQGFLTGPGQYWLPVAVTIKGLLYGELIGQDTEGHYIQPVHLKDKTRQPLYSLAQALLNEFVTVTPGCYLLQVGWHHGLLQFERLWPFPIQPALASVGVQVPDLFYAHYLCRQGLPLTDLYIRGQVPFLELKI
jgi:hypothetical protein